MSENDLKKIIKDSYKKILPQIMLHMAELNAGDMRNFMDRLECDSDFNLQGSIDELKDSLEYIATGEDEYAAEFIRDLWNHAEAGSQLSQFVIPAALLREAGSFSPDFNTDEAFDLFLKRISNAAANDDLTTLSDFMILAFLGYKYSTKSAIEPS